MKEEFYEYYVPASIKKKKMQGFAAYLNMHGSIKLHGGRSEEFRDGYKEAIKDVWEFIGFELHALRKK